MGRLDDEKYMSQVIELARSQMGITSPDPMVGAVIVKDNKLISAGYHAQQGTPHAEAMAIKLAGIKAKGATLYINLEPCSHYGNNPPCADAVIKAGVARVVAAIKDPNPLVSGKGFKKLLQAGVEVDIGVLSKEAKELNEGFIEHITNKTPFVILKSAMSLDGKVATKTGDSKYITGLKSRQYVHMMRVKVDAILTTVKTIKIDDPMFTVRDTGGLCKITRNPQRIVVDVMAEINLKSKILKNDPENTVVVVSSKAIKRKVQAIADTGATIITMPSNKGNIDLKKLMKVLGGMNIMSIMIEAGGNFSAACLDAGIVNKVIYFIAPKLIGGASAPTPFEGSGISKLKDLTCLKNVSYKKMDEDMLVEAYL